jgi:pyroglutamyl-peptidase
MKNLLITGFDPFGGEVINPAWEAVKLLPETLGDWQLHKLEIPTVFSLAAETVLAAANKLQPDVILCIGQAGGRSTVTPERIGINLMDARIPDNRGNQPNNIPIHPDGPDGIFSPLPVKTMAQAISDAGFPGAVSNTAGTFVCNEVLYRLLFHYQNTPVKVGFIHLPYLPEQGEPSLPLASSSEALKAAISVL